MIKKALLIAMLLTLLILFIQVNIDLEANMSVWSRHFLLESGYRDTASLNLVTSIYLDYRLLDSIFEASTLLIAVSGIVIISIKDDELTTTRPLTVYDTNESVILSTVSRIIYPFLLMFGSYIIVQGHLSPGGGFQGGAILATAVLVTYFFNPFKVRRMNRLLVIEKIVFILIIGVAFSSIFTRGVPFTNLVPLEAPQILRTITLYILNILIGLKVALGLVSIFLTFMKEGVE